MGQNAAQGILDEIGKIRVYVGGKRKEKPAPRKIDTRWHEQMLKRANDDFAKLAAAKTAPKKEPMLGAKKQAKKGGTYKRHWSQVKTGKRKRG